jgi:TPR repeat protein
MRPGLHRLFLAAVLAGSLWAGLPTRADDISTSDATFNEAVRAVKDKNYSHAVQLFTVQAEADQHDAQYNLALLLKSGKGHPQNFQQSLIWAWSAWLGGIEKGAELAEEVLDMLPEDSVAAAREAVKTRLQDRIAAGQKAALMQFARLHTDLLEEQDWQAAYIWYAIAAAVGLEGAIEARDEALDNLEDANITELQAEAGKLFEGLELQP